MPGPSVDIGRDLQWFADPQSSFKAAGSDFPVAADAVRAITAAANAKAPFAMFEDKRGTSTPLGVINQKRTAEFSLECYAYTTTRGTAPDWSEMLTSGGWQVTVGSGDATSATGGTTTVITTADTTNWAIGDAAIIETGLASGSYEIRRITNLTTNTNFTVSPALRNTPASGANILAGIIYKPKDAKDTTPDALTLWAANNRSIDRIIGGVVGTTSLSMGGDEAARITFSGTGRRGDRLVATTLNDSGGINNSVTTFTVTDGTVIPSDASANLPFYFKMEDEVFKVIGVSGTTVTVDTRGSTGLGGGAATHADGLEFYPYQPTGTFAGTPIPATSGSISVGGANFRASTVTVEVDQGIIFRENEHGDAFQVNGYVGGRRAVTASLEGWSFYDSTMIAALSAVTRTSKQVLVQQGESEGGIMAVELPTFKFEEPDMDRGGDEVTVSMSGQAVGTAAETEVYIMVG